MEDFQRAPRFRHSSEEGGGHPDFARLSMAGGGGHPDIAKY